MISSLRFVEASCWPWRGCGEPPKIQSLGDDSEGRLDRHRALYKKGARSSQRWAIGMLNSTTQVVFCCNLERQDLALRLPKVKYLFGA